MDIARGREGDHMLTGQSPPPTLRRADVLALAARPDSYAFLSLALRILPQCPGDTELRLHVLRHYAALGLFGPAVEVAKSLPDDVRRLPELTDAIGKFSRLPSGRVSWDELRPRFEANLAALGDRLPERDEIERAWSRCRDAWELYRCGDGNWQISMRDDRGERVWLPGLANHKAVAAATTLPTVEGELLPPPPLFEGLHLGWLFERAVVATRKTFLNYRPPVYVIEPNLLAVAAVLHLHEWAELLAEPRVYVFAGAGGSARFRDLLLADEQLPVPRHCIRMAPWGPPPEPSAGAVVEEIGDKRLSQCHALHDELEAIYAGRDAAWWARRFDEAGPADPLRVQLIVSRHTTYLQYAIRDIAAACERRGLRARILIEKDDSARTTPLCFLRAAREFEPDLYFVIDHFRREYTNLVPASVPFVGWIQDELPNLYSREAGASIGPFDFYIAPHLTDFVTRYGYPASQGLRWTTATDDRAYSAAPMPDDVLAKYRCDISFVSNQSRPPRAFHEDRRRAFTDQPDALRMTDVLYEALEASLADDPRTACADPGTLYWRLKHEAGGQAIPPETDDALVNYYMAPLAELMFRQHTLEWVAEYCGRTGRTLHLYGNGWDTHPRFAAYARGFARNGEELRAIYQASAINLQITRYGAVHQRLLDGLAAGGFFLIRYRPHDVAQPYVERFLAACERYDVRPDVDYDAREVPELADAMTELWRLYGVPLPGESFKVPAGAVRQFKELQASGYRRVAASRFGPYGEVAFASPEEFARLADHFLGAPRERAEITASMRQTVIESFTYGALLDELLPFIRQRLREAAGS